MSGALHYEQVSQPDEKDTDKQSSVSDALKAAQAALTDAEEQLAHVELLPSAKIRWEVPNISHKPCTLMIPWHLIFSISI